MSRRDLWCSSLTALTMHFSRCHLRLHPVPAAEPAQFFSRRLTGLSALLQCRGNVRLAEAGFAGHQHDLWPSPAGARDERLHATESGDKLTRFGPFSSQCRAGNVKTLRGPWNEDLFRVLEGFSDLADDDEVDACDACSGALERLDPQMKSSASLSSIAGRPSSCRSSAANCNPPVGRRILTMKLTISGKTQAP